MIKLFWFLYNKWVLKQCPHICCLCKYKDEMFKSCKDDMEHKLNIED